MIAPSQYEETLIKELSPHIPVIVLPLHTRLDLPGSSRLRRMHHASSIRPRSPLDLRVSLLRSSDTLSTLRHEATDRFLRWREVERSVENALRQASDVPVLDKAVREWKMHSDAAEHAGSRPLSSMRWDKARWEAEWEGSLSSEVSKVLRQRRSERMSQGIGRRPLDRRLTVTAKTRPVVSAYPMVPLPVSSPSSLALSDGMENSDHSLRPLFQGETFVRERSSSDLPSISLDPLHFPSLFAFSYTLLSPLRIRLAKIFSIPSLTQSALAAQRAPGLSIGIIISAFCAGIGFSFVMAKFKT